jgi:hypothetical protein
MLFRSHREPSLREALPVPMRRLERPRRRMDPDRRCFHARGHGQGKGKGKHKRGRGR